AGYSSLGRCSVAIFVRLCRQLFCAPGLCAAARSIGDVCVPWCNDDATMHVPTDIAKTRIPVSRLHHYCLCALARMPLLRLGPDRTALMGAGHLVSAHLQLCRPTARAERGAWHFTACCREHGRGRCRCGHGDSQGISSTL